MPHKALKKGASAPDPGQVRKKAELGPDPEREITIKPGCTICKTCEYLAPELFEVSEGELCAEPLVRNIETRAQWHSLKEAIKNCPVKIIQYRRRVRGSDK